MYYDYARRYSPVMLSRQRVATRIYPGVVEGGYLRHAMVWTVAAGMILVLASCFGLGMKLKRDQAELMMQQTNQRQLELAGRELTGMRDQLVSRKSIEQTVKKNGLSSPVGDQVIRL